MREQTSEERELLDRRRIGFDVFLNERMPVLTDFMRLVELPDPALVLVQADQYLPAINQWLKTQAIEPADRTWILTRIGYFIGEYLVQRLGGCWFLNEVSDSRYFGRYVVGQFVRASNPNAMVDPFTVADICVTEPPGRSLLSLLESVERDIAEA